MSLTGISNIKKFCLILLFCAGVAPGQAQKVAKVHATYSYTLGENDNVTIKEARVKAIEMAQAEAIRNEFGTMVVSDFINTDKAVDDQISSLYVSDTRMSVKGDWLGDEKPPVVTMEVAGNGNDLIFTAQVWGSAREIVRAATEIDWKPMKDKGGTRIEADHFDSGERVFVRFKAPADGYVAVYLISDADDDTSCLLPYRKSISGRYEVRAGKEYTFFDKAEDPQASFYSLKTNRLQELNQIVVVFSPNPFTKCTDVSNDPRHPNTLHQKDFARWLLKSQRADNEMVVARRWLTINGSEQ